MRRILKTKNEEIQVSVKELGDMSAKVRLRESCEFGEKGETKWVAKSYLKNPKEAK